LTNFATTPQVHELKTPYWQIPYGINTSERSQLPEFMRPISRNLWRIRSTRLFQGCFAASPARKNRLSWGFNGKRQ